MSARLFPLLLLAWLSLAGRPGSRVEYVGGTLTAIAGHPEGSLITADDRILVFAMKTTAIRIPYDRINLIEYGQKVDRRYAMAILISPMFLLSKARRHFLTIGYADDQERQQAMVFQVNKNDIRAVLVTLEARTGRKVQYQDEEARKAGKG